MKIQTYRDLIAWQKGKVLACEVYRASIKMPKSELFAMTSQMRRAAYSIPLNIAEGFGKHTRPAFINGLRTAMGSLCELSTALEIAWDLAMIERNQRIVDLLAEEDRILQALIMKLDAKEKERPAMRPSRARRPS